MILDSEMLVAPANHLGVLVQPAPAEIHAALAAESDPRLSSFSLFGTPLHEWRRRTRAALSLRGPLVVTGHQAEFFHAGVLAKNMAARSLASEVGGTAVFLCVDSDVPKAVRLTYPARRGDELVRETLAIPGMHPRLSMSQQPRARRNEWAEWFAALSRNALPSDGRVLPLFAEAWLKSDEPELDFCGAFDRARRASEFAAGCAPLDELRLSHLSRNPGLRCFLAYSIVHAEAMADYYNQAREAFRRRHGVRSAQRPLPALHLAADLCELPFWITPAGQARRRLFVARAGESVRFYADALPIGTCRVGDLADIAGGESPFPFELVHSASASPRALALSGFVRLFLADLFLHGIGGARYDEITSDWLSRAMGVAPPPIACVSATLRLPLPALGVGITDLREARGRTRDLKWNPQRHIRQAPPVLLQRRAELLSTLERLRAAGADRAQRRRTYQALQDVRLALLSVAPDLVQATAAAADQIERQLAQERISTDREYFFGFHSTETVVELNRRVKHALRPEAR